jgi:D-3-phosphoglycerate dehydrogenase
MLLLGNDILEISPDFIFENGIEMTSLESLLTRADFVSLNCDLNPTSYHLINKQTLEWIKPGAVLINTSRGPVVAEPDLIEALQSGILGGAALDVFEHEPLPSDSPLLKMDQVMLAPHNANSSPTCWETVHWNTIRNLLDGLGLPLQDIKTDIIPSD